MRTTARPCRAPVQRASVPALSARPRFTVTRATAEAEAKTAAKKKDKGERSR
jgi:hypothetical protein